MPVVIKELLITATIQGQPQTAGADTPAAPAYPALPSPKFLQDCVSQVLAVLREQAER